MKRVFLVLALLGSVMVAVSALADEGDAILGQWLTAEGRSVVEIYKCGDSYCGKIVWLKEPLDKEGKEKTDIHNPDESLRSRKLMGLEILHSLKYKGNNEYKGGRIYDPQKGKTYKCKAKLEGDKLKLRGYIGFSLIGRTSTWTRKH